MSEAGLSKDAQSVSEYESDEEQQPKSKLKRGGEMHHAPLRCEEGSPGSGNGMVTARSWKTSPGNGLLRVFKLCLVWVLVGLALVALVNSNGKTPRRDANDISFISQQLSVKRHQHHGEAKQQVPNEGGARHADEQERRIYWRATKEGGAAAGDTEPPSSSPLGASSEKLKPSNEHDVPHGKCVGEMCEHLFHHGSWATSGSAGMDVHNWNKKGSSSKYVHNWNNKGSKSNLLKISLDRHPILANVKAELQNKDMYKAVSATKLEASSVRATKLTITSGEEGESDGSPGQGLTDTAVASVHIGPPPRSSSGPHNLAGWLQKVPGSRPDSVDYSSAGPGWLGRYNGQLKATTGEKMNMHLHRLLFEACQSSTMDFNDAEECVASHGTAAAAMQFLRDIPNIKIDNSKSETAQYIYGSDPYLLGEDWPRSNVSVADAVYLSYRSPSHTTR